jgi:hypothetical protein
VRRGTSPERSNPRVPISPAKPTVAPWENPRDVDGRFMPPILTPDEEQDREEARDAKKLVRFSDVLEAMEMIDPGVTPGNADPVALFFHGAVRRAVAYVRSKLLFQGNPKIRQRLRPLYEQNPSAQAAMGAGAPTSITRRVGGTGFAAFPAPLPSKASVTKPPKKKKTDSQRLRR